MLKSDAIEHFGSQAAISEKTGYAESTVSGWPDVIPLEAALVIEDVTRRRLRVDRSLYPRLARLQRRSA